MNGHTAPVPARTARALVGRLDALLRRCHGVYEFTTDPACILRIAPATARRATELADGTRVEPGELLVEIHLWNERLPQMPPEGADLAWARRMYRGFTASLQLLAKYLALEPQLAAVRALHGEAAFLTSSGLDTGVGVLSRLGFELRRPRAQAGALARFAGLWPNLYSYALLWTFNPGSLPGKTPWALERFALWMSRATLDERYGSGGARR